jgi:hypothetical protein
VTAALAAADDAACACASASDERGDAEGQVTESFSVESAAEHYLEGSGNSVQEDARQTLDVVFEQKVIVQCEATPSLEFGSEDTARQTSTPSDYVVEAPVVANAALHAVATACDESASRLSNHCPQTWDFNMQRTSEGPNKAAYIDTVTVVPLVGLHGRTAAAAHATRALHKDELPPAVSPFLNLRTREVRCEVIFCRCS